MTDRELLALLKASERHWIENIRLLPKNGDYWKWFYANCRGNLCPLCQTFFDDCAGCPLNDWRVTCCTEWKGLCGTAFDYDKAPERYGEVKAAAEAVLDRIRREQNRMVAGRVEK